MLFISGVHWSQPAPGLQGAGVSEGAICGTSGPLYYLRWTLWCSLAGPLFKDNKHIPWGVPWWSSCWESAFQRRDVGSIPGQGLQIPHATRQLTHAKLMQQEKPVLHIWRKPVCHIGDSVQPKLKNSNTLKEKK